MEIDPRFTPRGGAVVRLHEMGEWGWQKPDSLLIPTLAKRSSYRMACVVGPNYRASDAERCAMRLAGNEPRLSLPRMTPARHRNST